MKTHHSVNAFHALAVVLIAMLLLQPAQVQAQETTPPGPRPVPVLYPEVASPEDALMVKPPQDTGYYSPFSLAAPKDYFGYTMYATVKGDPEVSYGWIDAFDATKKGQSGCKKADLSGSEDSTLITFASPHRFKFYENEYASVYATTESYLSFGGGSSVFENSPLPLPAVPNNLISVFWDDLSIDLSARPDSGLYVCETNDYIVFEWHDVFLYKYQGQGSGTFEAILYWNSGDIKIQYQSFDGDDANATTGIEDSRGRDGLTYQYNDNTMVASHSAILFDRPQRSARVNAWPDYQGEFPIYNDSETYDSVTFPVNVVNTGDLESKTTDTFTVTLSGDTADWVYTFSGLEAGQKITVPQGASKEFSVQLFAPSDADVGDSINVTVHLTSTNNPAMSKVVHLQVAIPAPFVQSYWENDSDSLVLSMIERARQDTFNVKTGVQNTGGLAIIRRPIGYAYLWDQKREIPGGTYEVSEINYALLDLKGTLQGGSVKKMTDHGNASQFIFESDVAVAVAPNGRIGALWLRRTGASKDAMVNNLYFAVLNNSGQMVGGAVPIALTENTTANYPTYRELQISATSDSHFALSWREQTKSAPGISNNIVYTVLDTDGRMLMFPMRYQVGAAGSDDLFFAPALTGLKDGRFMMAWGHKSIDRGTYLTEFAVFTSWGKPLMNPQSIADIDNGAGRVDMAELFDGQVVMAIPFGDIQTVILKYDPSVGTYQQETTPVPVSHPSCVTLDNRYVSVTATQNNQAVMTWTCYKYEADTNKDGISPYQYDLYYALIGSNGQLVTAPQIFYSSKDASTPLLQLNQFGYHNSTHPRLKVGVVDYILSVPETLQVNPGEVVESPAFYMNIGKMSGSGADLVATLDPSLEPFDIIPSPTSHVGNVIKWNLPDMGFLDSGSVTMKVRSSQEGAYPIKWQINAQFDDFPEDNQGTTVLRFEVPKMYHGGRVMLPIVRR